MLIQHWFSGDIKIVATEIDFSNTFNVSFCYWFHLGDSAKSCLNLTGYVVIHWLHTFQKMSKAGAKCKILCTILVYFSLYAPFFALQEKVQVSSCDRWEGMIMEKSA